MVWTNFDISGCCFVSGKWSSTTCKHNVANEMNAILTSLEN